MTSRRDGRRLDPHNPTIRGIADQQRREILKAVITRSPTTEGALAASLTAGTPGARSERSGRAEHVRLELTNIHLPALADAGLVAWDRANRTVETTTHPALGDPRFERLLGIESDGLDGVLSVLCHEYRRIALLVLREERNPLSRAGLAKEILRHHEGVETPDSDAVNDVSVRLYHVHLPKLAEGALIEYDSRADRATYAPHPVLEAVFTVMYEPDGSVVDRYDGFIGGLYDSYDRTWSEGADHSGWPHFWGEFHHG